LKLLQCFIIIIVVVVGIIIIIIIIAVLYTLEYSIFVLRSSFLDWIMIFLVCYLYSEVYILWSGFLGNSELPSLYVLQITDGVLMYVTHIHYAQLNLLKTH